jgi:hypothetical protein
MTGAQTRVLIEQCRREIRLLIGKNIKKDYLRDKIRGFDKVKTPGMGYFHIQYRVGNPTTDYCINCCKIAFSICYGVGKTLVSELISGIKVR